MILTCAYSSGSQNTHTEPTTGLVTVSPLDDDLLKELRASGLGASEEITGKINASSELFRSSPPHNACLNDVCGLLSKRLRLALSLLRRNDDSPPYENTNGVLYSRFLRSVEFITQEEGSLRLRQPMDC